MNQMRDTLVIPEHALANLRSWATSRGQSVTVFDLETTTNIPQVKWIGITELGLLTVKPGGRIKTLSAFVDPERNIPRVVRDLTGIRNEDVTGKPTWEAWAARLHHHAREHVMIGYNSSRFDCIVIAKQNARYGVEDTSFAYSLDVMTLPDIQGTLEETGKQFGLTAATYHRALADVWLTAQIADHIAGMQGTSVLDRCIRVVAGGGPFSPRKEREAELLAFYEMKADLPDLTDFSERHGIKTSTAEGDVERLIAAGRMPRSLLENPEVQEWLAIELPNAIRECWIDDAEGRLKPLMQHLQDRAPDGFDYTQLKLALHARENKET